MQCNEKEQVKLESGGSGPVQPQQQSDGNLGPLYRAGESVGSTGFFTCAVCPYMALAEDDIKFHAWSEHAEMARAAGLVASIACPGCAAERAAPAAPRYDTHAALQQHLRQHHRMAPRDARKMLRSLVQRALSLVSAATTTLTPTSASATAAAPLLGQPMPSSAPPAAVTPPVIEIAPDAQALPTAQPLPSNVAYISVNELQNMSTPNLDNIDPKEMIQEASLNIVYSEEISSSFVYVNSGLSANAAYDNSGAGCSSLLANSTPDLLSSIPKSSMNTAQIPLVQLPSLAPKKIGRPIGAKSSGITALRRNGETSENAIVEKFGRLCSVSGCGVRLHNEEKYRYHVRCHVEGLLQCGECGVVFQYVAALHTHLWKVHSVDLELPTCDLCGYKTYSLSRLNNIHKKSHGGERAHRCEQCGKRFKTNKHLSKHRRVHRARAAEPSSSAGGASGGSSSSSGSEGAAQAWRAQAGGAHQLHACPHPACQYGTARAHDLRTHLRTHTGDKPLACALCPHRAADPSAMRRHALTHAPPAARPHACPSCPYTAVQGRSLRRHLAAAHPLAHPPPRAPPPPPPPPPPAVSPALPSHTVLADRLTLTPHGPVLGPECDAFGAPQPRKKPKISVKSNLILKGPDGDDTFHSEQKMAFERMEYVDESSTGAGAGAGAGLGSSALGDGGDALSLTELLLQEGWGALGMDGTQDGTQDVKLDADGIKAEVRGAVGACGEGEGEGGRGTEGEEPPLLEPWSRELDALYLLEPASPPPPPYLHVKNIELMKK